VLTNRLAVGYMLAMTMLLGGLFGFINSAQQVFVDTFQAPGLFTTIFALVAVAMAAASLLNAKLVGRFGTRRISHTMLLGYIFFAIAHAALACGAMSNCGASPSAGGDDVLLRPHRSEFRLDGHGAAGPHRRHGVLRAGLRHHGGRRVDRLHDRSAIQWQYRADEFGLRRLRHPGPGHGAVRGEWPAVPAP
jgi:hypothetical protein